MTTVFRFPPFVVAPATRLLLRDGVPVPLTPKTFDILLILIERRDRVVSKAELLLELWPDAAVEEATLSQHIYMLRKALNDAEDGARYIETIPRRGYRFMADVSESDGQAAGAAGSPPPPTIRVRGWEWIAASVLVLAIALASELVLYRAPVATPLRFTIASPPGISVADLALSADGQTAVFHAIGSDGNDRLWVKRLDSLLALPLDSTDGGRYPFWSPDGRAVAFFTGGKLKKISVTGGPPDVICDAPDGRGGTWNRDNLIIFAPTSRSGLSRVSAAGGEVAPVTRLEPTIGTVSHRWPSFLPDGHHFLFLQMSGRAATRGIFVGSVDGTASTRVLPDDSSAAYAREGFLLFSREDSLVAQPFDARRLRITGDPLLVARNVGRFANMYAPFTISDNGRLIYEAHDRRSRFVWLDRRGHQLAAVGAPARQGDPMATPNGNEVLSWKGEEDAVDLWLDDVRRGTSSRVTYSGQDILPIWSPSGDEVIFRSNRNGPGDLYRKSLRRTDPEVLLMKGAVRTVPTDWSPDGRYVLYDEYDGTDANRRSDMWVLPLFGDRRPARYESSPFARWGGRFSPNGRLVAFAADETGKAEIYVQAFPAGSVRWRVSINGGTQPQWRRDGRELFYLAADGWLSAVLLAERGMSLTFGAPQRLFQVASKVTFLRNLYAVSGDGERFLVDTPVEDTAAVPLTVVIDWQLVVHRE